MCLVVDWACLGLCTHCPGKVNTNFCMDADRYARQVELTNGRWAMLGFLAAIVVEAATGQGIFGQLIMWLKWVGLLGEASGF
jgi:Chlorophyll A-B binding protein